MVVLVTGGTGYIGSALIRALPFSKGFEGETVRIFDNMAGEKYYSLFDLPEARYEFCLGDLRREEDLRRALRDVDTVFDLAGITSVPLSFAREKETYEVNVEGARRLLEVALGSGVERVVYSSSAAVYGNVEGLVREDHECSPASPYARSKLLAERLYLECHRDRGLRVSVLRLGTVFGYAPGMRFDTVVNKFTFLACTGSPLTVWRGAEGAMRPYLYVGDAVQAFLLAATRPEAVGQVYNVTTVNARLGEVIEAVSRVVPGVRVNLVEAEYKQQVSYGLDITRIRGLGYEPRGSLERGIREVAEKLRAFYLWGG